MMVPCSYVDMPMLSDVLKKTQHCAQLEASKPQTAPLHNTRRKCQPGQQTPQKILCLWQAQHTSQARSKSCQHQPRRQRWRPQQQEPHHERRIKKGNKHYNNNQNPNDTICKMSWFCSGHPGLRDDSSVPSRCPAPHVELCLLAECFRDFGGLEN